jgi:uncharacterized zinc-type alcohol dehydrogenase-like protein
MIPVKGYAALEPKSHLTPWNFERREPGPHDVQIEISYCGICHTDLHQVNNDWFPGIFPMVPGHEIVGKITKIGAHVKKFREGDLAGIGVMVDSCGTCPECASHQEQFCSVSPVSTYNAKGKDGQPTYGGYSNIIVVHEDFTFHISEKLDLKGVGPLLCAGITTYSPLRRWGISKGHKLAVLGLGGLGHMAVKFGVALGAEVTVLSTSARKEADAKKLGVKSLLVSTDADAMNAAKGSFDFILDCVSAPHDLNMYLALLKTNAVYICVGIPAEPFVISPFALLAGAKTITGSGAGGLKETQEMLDFCAEHNIVADVELIDIKDINTAFERMEKGDVRYRFVIDMATLNNQ